MNSKQPLSDWLIRRAAIRTVFKPETSDEQRPVVFIDQFLWGKSLETKADFDIQAGFHDASALERLLAQQALFSGLVVSIGISPMNPASRNLPETLDTIRNFLLSLMRMKDFACLENSGGFLLICPGLTQVEASQHLNSLSERLWEFQLQSLDPVRNAAPFLLSAGAFDTERESLGEAIASARERMIQTQRSRISIASLTLNHLGKAV